MTGYQLYLLLDLIRQISTEIVHILVVLKGEKVLSSLIFQLDLMIILLTFLVQKVASKHLAVRPMGLRLGYTPYYTDRQLDRMETIFARGLQAERAHLDPGRRGAFQVN